MKVIVTSNYEEMCAAAAQMILNQVRNKPNSKLGLATGGTACGVYDVIVREYTAHKVDFSNVKTVNLDEYMGVEPNNEISYAHYMKERLFDKVNLKPENTYVASGKNDVAEETKLFNDRLNEGGVIDLQLLGVGVNGHIGFNEPAEELVAGVHVVELSESTILANSRFFESIADVPHCSITMGVGDILKAKKIVLIASGKEKMQAITYLLMNDKVSTKVPVSLLKLHADATVIIDKELADAVGYVS